MVMLRTCLTCWFWLKGCIERTRTDAGEKIHCLWPSEGCPSSYILLFGSFWGRKMFGFRGQTLQLPSMQIEHWETTANSESVCVKSRKRNRNNGMTDNLSSLFHSQPANISKHSSPRPKHSSALHGAMASLQSTLNVQAFCFPFPFHGINQTAKAKKVVALQAWCFSVVFLLGLTLKTILPSCLPFHAGSCNVILAGRATLDLNSARFRKKGPRKLLSLGRL